MYPAFEPPGLKSNPLPIPCRIVPCCSPIRLADHSNVRRTAGYFHEALDTALIHERGIIPTIEVKTLITRRQLRTALSPDFRFLGELPI
jgi:hypothetical protein